MRLAKGLDRVWVCGFCGAWTAGDSQCVECKSPRPRFVRWCPRCAFHTVGVLGFADTFTCGSCRWTSETTDARECVREWFDSNADPLRCSLCGHCESPANPTGLVTQERVVPSAPSATLRNDLTNLVTPGALQNTRAPDVPPEHENALADAPKTPKDDRGRRKIGERGCGVLSIWSAYCCALPGGHDGRHENVNGFTWSRERGS